MPVNQPTQRDEIAAGQRKKCDVRRDFLQRQAAVPDQEHKKSLHHFPRHLTIA
jgi:hypothetical protein